MSAKVDALFAGEPPATVELGPVLARLKLLLGVSLPLNLLGPLCWTGVPGAVLTLWAWSLADREAAAVSAGAVRGDQATSLLRLRRFAATNLGLCVLSLFVQVSLLATDFYPQLLSAMLDRLTGP